MPTRISRFFHRIVFAIEVLTVFILVLISAPAAQDVHSRPAQTRPMRSMPSPPRGSKAAQHNLVAGTQFLEAPSYSTNCCAYAVALADINGDGNTDVVTSDNSGNTISVLLGNGDGTFQEVHSFATPASPIALAVGDLNRDGKQDVVVATTAGIVGVLMGKGDGTFWPHRDYAISSVNGGVAIADFNSDGKPDVAVTNSSANTVTVLLGNGDGTFRQRHDYQTASWPTSIAVADVDGNGIPDLAVVDTGQDSVSILRGNGDGTFQPHEDYGTGYAGYSDFIAVGDFNGDGMADLAVSDGNNNMSSEASEDCVFVLLNDGSGHFWYADPWYVGAAPYSVVAGDFNGDGKLDLATANSEGASVSVLLGNGDGTFAGSNSDYGASGPASWLMAGDLNRDGKADLVVADGGVTVLVGHGDGSFQARLDYAVGRASPSSVYSVVVGDFNHDNKLDMVATSADGNDNGQWKVILGKGNGTFSDGARGYFIDRSVYQIVTADLNGDGNLDLAAALDDNNVNVMLGNGDGTFRDGIDYPNSGAQSIGIVDLNRDGKFDLVAAGWGEVDVFLGNGDGTFQPYVESGTGHGRQTVAVGDFNGDGNPDLVTSNADDGTVSLLLGNGDGTFQEHVDYPTGGGPASVLLGDLNRDGHLDIVVANQWDNTISVLLGNGDRTFDPHQDLPLTGYINSIHLADLNRDGKLDLVVLSGSSLSVLSGNGDATFQSPVSYSTGGGIMAAVGDFNNDTNLDLATANVNKSFSVSILMNTAGTSNIPVASLSPAPLTFAVRLVGSRSSAQAVTLTNVGGVTLHLTSISTSGDFSETNRCHLNLTPGASCTVWVTFDPTDINARTGKLSVYDDAADSPQTVWLSGTGTEVKLSVSRLSFGSVPVGHSSAPRTVTLTNAGKSNLNITSVQMLDDFTQTNTCNGSVGAGMSCTFSVTFKPRTTGQHTGTLIIQDDGGASPQQVTLTGYGR